MPPVTFDGRSFSQANRRLWVTGARCEYTLCPPQGWADRLMAIKQQGFNTVLSSCPWLLHEPSKGRYDFSDGLDVAGFLRLAHEQGLRVILRIGPAVGRPFDGAGLPAWLADEPDVQVREADPAFMNICSKWYAKVAEQVADLQADQEGGNSLLAIQVEHDWFCGAVEPGRNYLGELVRFARERGFSVPILTSNGFWQDVEQAIETWVGWDDLLRNLRQVRALQSGKPRLAVLSPPGNDRHVGAASGRSCFDGAAITERIGSVLAAGGQPILDDAVQSIHVHAAPGADHEGPLSTVPVAQALLDETGEPTEAARLVKRIASFSSNFGALLSDLDPDTQPVTLDVTASSGDIGPAIVGMHGDGGRVNWIFRGGSSSEGCTLLLDDGVQIPVSFGDSPVAWFVVGADLHGTATLDYANVPPYAVVGRRMLVLQGPARTAVFLSINGAPTQLAVPEDKPDGGAPLCVEHAGITVVVCNQAQIDRSVVHEDAFHFGVRRIDASGTLHAAGGVKKPLKITADGTITAIETVAGRKVRKRSIASWEIFDEPDPRNPDHPRAVKVDGDLGLSSVGAAFDYGWFSAQVKASKASGLDLRFLGGLPDALMWIDGKPVDPVKDARTHVKLPRGEHVLSLLARHAPRRFDGATGAGQGDRPGSLVVVEPLKNCRRKVVKIDPADPFQVRRFVAGAADGQRTASHAETVTFTHRKKSPLLVEIEAGIPGIVMLNGESIAYHDGQGMRLQLVPRETEGFKSGENVVAFTPLENSGEDLDEPMLAVQEVVDELVVAEDWRFRRWEQPDERIGSWRELDDGSAAEGFRPRWFRTTVSRINRNDGSGHLELRGLSRGRAWLDGVPLGAYELKAPGTGKESSANARLPVPFIDTEPSGAHTLLLFDEGGDDPSEVTLRL
ncbi:MAG: beta-galactosidase [Phycisphaerales bacterium]|nr:beta-galactosidase [Phycisphaerales bacterium]